MVAGAGRRPGTTQEGGRLEHSDEQGRGADGAEEHRDAPVEAGDVAVAVQISPCVGGLVRTWAGDGSTELWETPDAAQLRAQQAGGLLARTEQSEGWYREAALILQSGVAEERTETGHQVGGAVVRLKSATAPTEDDAYGRLEELLERAVVRCAEQGGTLMIGRGGWDAPAEPFCVFAVLEDEDGVHACIQTAPDPVGSPVWDPHIVPGRDGQTLSAPADPATITVAAAVMLGAVATWSVTPWDLALSFHDH